MSRISWNQAGDKRYESGVDRGVLYSLDHLDGFEHPIFLGVPWHGLTSVTVKTVISSESIYFGGRKIGEISTVGDFQGSIGAIMYPDEMLELEGMGSIRRGVWVGQQQPKPFCLCWRTMIGSDQEDDVEHYKLHAAWNLIATPSDKSYATISADPSLTPFSWDVTSTPEDLDGHRPTSYLVIDTRETDPWLVELLEGFFYGNDFYPAFMNPAGELVKAIENWARFMVIDNDDGTWTGVEARESTYIFPRSDGDVDLKKVEVFWLDEETFTISNMDEDLESQRITVRDNLDGTVTISSDRDGVIVQTGLGSEDWNIINVDLDFIGPDMFRISTQHPHH